MNQPDDNLTSSTRRNFIGQSAAKVASASALVGGLQRSVHSASGSDVIRIGLVGCGGRGSGAALQALNADPKTQLVAVADTFEHRLTPGLQALKRSAAGERVLVDKEYQFIGLDAYKKLLETDVDVVLLATPPGFRPLHIQAAVEAGKHIFAEKPVAVDSAGVKAVLAATQQAQQKGLLFVVGLQTRYEPTTQEMVARIQNGAIGDIVTMRTTRFGQQTWTRPRKPGMTDVAHQVDNWQQFTWLSGDFVVEQFVHEIDRIAWIIGADPVSCLATGGRQTRTGPDTGHIYDHFSAIFKYAGGVEFHAATRQQRGCQAVWEMDVAGTLGRCTGTQRTLYNFTGPNAAQLKAPPTAASRVGHQLEHDAMYTALRKGDSISNGEYAAKSTLMAIMARDSAYSGQQILWQDKLDSNERLVDMHGLSWETELPQWKIAMPGIHGIV